VLGFLPAVAVHGFYSAIRVLPPLELHSLNLLLAITEYHYFISIPERNSSEGSDEKALSVVNSLSCLMGHDESGEERQATTFSGYNAPQNLHGVALES